MVSSLFQQLQTDSFFNRITATLHDIAIPDNVRSVVKDVNVKFKTLVRFNIRKELRVFNAIQPLEVRLAVAMTETLR